MTLRVATVAFLVLVALLAAFVWTSAASMLPAVASHFDGAGTADGYMSRSAYRLVLVLLIVAVPLLLGLLPVAATMSDRMRLNIPNREYWLAPERRAETLAFLRVHGLWFASFVALFLAYVHWLVVEANRLHPPRLSTVSIQVGLAAFFIVLIVWLVVLYKRFPRRRA